MAATETVCDTIGLGQREFHHIAYVVKKERLQTKEHHELYELFRSTFQGAEDNLILVVTHCPNPMWVTDIRENLTQTFGRIPVVTCDFPTDTDDLSYRRQERLDSLLKFEAKLAAVLMPHIVLKLSTRETVTVKVQQEFTNSLEEFLKFGKSIVDLALGMFIQYLAARSLQ
ncbi:hypothetical protein BGZ98_002743 [Dissophora globulifera]|nr:hypothetical protein BGZ98_002743 [Dissophora globulifera]